MATWVVVPNLDNLRDQLNEIAPDRDKSSDGSIGNQAHQDSRSSHNDDLHGNPEYRDGDKVPEVRARDFDKDLRRPGLTMAMVIRHLVEGARIGRFWWLRYLIYDGIIYHKSNGFQARTYTGQNKHREHAHVNSDFTQAADTVRNVNYHLEELVALSETEMNKIADLTVKKLLGTPIKDAADNDGDRRSLSLRTWFEHFDGREFTTQRTVINDLTAKLDTIRASLAAVEDAIDALSAAAAPTAEALEEALRNVIRKGTAE